MQAMSTIMRRQDLVKRSAAYLSESCGLCADHFEESQFMKSQRRDSLVWNAVPPTLFNVPNLPKRLQSCRKLPLPRKPSLPRKPRADVSTPPGQSVRSWKHDLQY